ncbi:MAG: beta-ketoacyl-[acyl-carrier-protein] synthase family protein [Opitutales bacterium]
MKKVAITGLGFITSIGENKEEVLTSLRELKNGIEISEEFAKENTQVRCLGTVKGFKIEGIDAEDWQWNKELYPIKRTVLRGFAPHVLYAHCAVTQALKDAGLSPEDVANDDDTGMYTASAGSTNMLYSHMQRMDKVGAAKAHPMGVVSSIVGTLSYNLVSAFQITGNSCGFASACASSSHALGFAYEEIRSGRQKRMLVIGGEDGDYRTIVPFAGMRALTTSDNPDEASRPFDKNRSGFVGTGGAVCMIIEDEELAKSRNADIYARINSWGQGSDGYNVAIPHPEGRGVVSAIKKALKAGNLTTDDIDYINAHGTSTPIGDVAELRAIKTVFGENAKMPISSTKAITGHGLSLAGVLEAGICALSLKNAIIPASAHITELDEEAKSLNIPMQTLEEQADKMMSLNSGFGGANTAIILEKA